jgi:hypothetical protein
MAGFAALMAGVGVGCSKLDKPTQPPAAETPFAAGKQAAGAPCPIEMWPCAGTPEADRVEPIEDNSLKDNELTAPPEEDLPAWKVSVRAARQALLAAAGDGRLSAAWQALLDTAGRAPPQDHYLLAQLFVEGTLTDGYAQLLATLPVVSAPAAAAQPCPIEDWPCAGTPEAEAAASGIALSVQSPAEAEAEAGEAAAWQTSVVEARKALSAAAAAGQLTSAWNKLLAAAGKGAPSTQWLLAQLFVEGTLTDGYAQLLATLPVVSAPAAAAQPCPIEDWPCAGTPEAEAAASGIALSVQSPAEAEAEAGEAAAWQTSVVEARKALSAAAAAGQLTSAWNKLLAAAGKGAPSTQWLLAQLFVEGTLTDGYAQLLKQLRPIRSTRSTRSVQIQEDPQPVVDQPQPGASEGQLTPFQRINYKWELAVRDYDSLKDKYDLLLEDWNSLRTANQDRFASPPLKAYQDSVDGYVIQANNHSEGYANLKKEYRDSSSNEGREYLIFKMQLTVQKLKIVYDGINYFYNSARSMLE